MPDRQFRLRLKLDNGIEFEAEGEPSLVLLEKERFLGLSSHVEQKPDRPTPAIGMTQEGTKMWESIAEHKNGGIYIKQKYPIEAVEAILLIAAAAKALTQIADYPALELSKALKRSGYYQGRLDRTAAPAVKNGLLAALGSKRNRRYSLTPKGQARAFALANRLISPNLCD